MKNLKSVAPIASALALLTLSSCATYKTTLTNAQGQTMTCEASGKSGLITGIYLRQGFEQCVSNAQAQGYSAKPVASSTPPSTHTPECPPGYTCTPNSGGAK